MTSELPRSNDASWLAAAACGDGSAFEPFVAEHEAVVYRVIHSLGLRDADADDALQETFIAAWRHAGTFHGDASARPWLLTIARNVVHRSRRRHVGEPADFEPLDGIAELAGWGGPSADTEREDDRRVLVHDALATLDQDDREILVLREIEGLSGDETAAALGLSLAGMKSRLHRARLRLTAAVRACADREGLR